MLRTIILLILGLQGIAFGQVSFTGQVFILSKDFIEDKCEVFAPCDCCATDLFFISADKFAFVSKCISGDVYSFGTYSTKDNKLKLNFNKKYVEEEKDEKYNLIGYKHSETNMRSIEFDIEHCEQKVRLTRPKDTRWVNGSRYDLSTEKLKIKKLKESVPWKQLSK